MGQFSISRTLIMLLLSPCIPIYCFVIKEHRRKILSPKMLQYGYTNIIRRKNKLSYLYQLTTWFYYSLFQPLYLDIHNSQTLIQHLIFSLISISLAITHHLFIKNLSQHSLIFLSHGVEWIMGVQKWYSFFVNFTKW